MAQKVDKKSEQIKSPHLAGTGRPPPVSHGHTELPYLSLAPKEIISNHTERPDLNFSINPHKSRAIN